MDEFLLDATEKLLTTTYVATIFFPVLINQNYAGKKM
jgi:hypothetical protein